MSEQNNTHEEELQEFNAFLSHDEEIPYPETEAWKNLGRTVRSRARTQDRRRIQGLIVFGAAAALMLGMFLWQNAAPVVPTPQVAEQPVAAEDAQALLASLQALSLQSELDYISMALSSTKIATSEERVAKLMHSYDIDQQAILKDYIDAL